MDNGTSETPSLERRGFRRHALKLNKIFSAEVLVEGTYKNCYLYVLDVSEGGMKITSHFRFPPSTPVPVTFLFERPLEVTIELVWQKSTGGTEIMGIKFVNLTDTARESVTQFMTRWSPAHKRDTYRLDRELWIEVGAEQKFFAMTLDIHPAGMRISLPHALLLEGRFPIRIQLEHNEPPVDVVGRVESQKVTSFDTHLVSIVFDPVDIETVARIDGYIDKAMAGTLDEPAPNPPPPVSDTVPDAVAGDAAAS